MIPHTGAADIGVVGGVAEGAAVCPAGGATAAAGMPV